MEYNGLENAGAPPNGWPASWTRHFLSEGRDWGAVAGFYRRLTAGELHLGSLGLTLLEHPASPPAAADVQGQSVQQPTPARSRATFKVHASYYGPAFSGWKQVQQEGDSVEEVARQALGELLTHRAAVAGAAPAGQQGTKPSPVVLSVAGRTDRGVHALGQVLSFYTWDSGLTPQDVVRAVNAARPGALRAWHAEAVPRSFHATFSAHWRRYLYLLPMRPAGCMAAAVAAAAAAKAAWGEAEQQAVSKHAAAGGAAADELHAATAACLYNEHCIGSPGSAVEAALQHGASGGIRSTTSKRGELAPWEAAVVESVADVDPARVAALLAPLEGRQLDCTAFARDTAPGRDTRCTLLRARAWQASLPGVDATPVLAVELVGDRFLRRMVRVLVATAVREAVPQAAWLSGGAGPAVSGVGAGAGAAAAAAAEQGTEGAAGAAGTPAPAAETAPQLDLHAEALLQIAAAGNRRITTPAAPAEGLCFLEAGYSAWGART